MLHLSDDILVLWVPTIKSRPSEIRNPLEAVLASSTNYYNYSVATINLDCNLAHLDDSTVTLISRVKFGCNN